MKKKEINTSHIGRLLWIIGGSLLIFFFLVWFYTDKDVDQSQNQEQTEQRSGKAGELGVVLQQDPEVKTYSTSVSGTCPLENCDANDGGTIIAINGDVITYDQQLKDGEPASGKKSRKEVIISEPESVRHFNVAELVYTEEVGLRVGDDFQAEISDGVAQNVTVIKYNK